MKNGCSRCESILNEKEINKLHTHDICNRQSDFMINIVYRNVTNKLKRVTTMNYIK